MSSIKLYDIINEVIVKNINYINLNDIKKNKI